jgi:carboxymethylenebutenolidase
VGRSNVTIETRDGRCECAWCLPDQGSGPWPAVLVYSLAAAANFPDRVAAAASFHGGKLVTDAPDSPHLLASRMKARVYVAGAVQDAGFTDEMKQRLKDALTAAHVDHTVVTYEGARHGWVPTDMPVHDRAAAERHYEALFDLLDSTLR